MKICFLVELPYGIWQWADGLYGAMQILGKEYEVCYHFDGLRHDHKPDLLMCWGGTLSTSYIEGLKFDGKKVLFFAGGSRHPDNFELYDMTFFENDIHTNEGRVRGIKCMTAFGTNTTVFKSMKQPKIFDVIYPGAFGLWKRKDLFARACKGLKALSLGNIQHHEMQCWNVCVDNGITVSADIPQSCLPYFYAMSKTVLVLPVPEIGCQRTVIEAMAMKIPVIVPCDAPLVVEFAVHGGIIVNPDEQSIRQAVVDPSGANTEEAYEYIINNLTEKHYADKIKEAIRIIS